jgi:electron transfer flavoprotein beta subunit
LSCAVRKLKYDIVLCGRQAIDGDTAQVGPQLAEKLNVPQITYVEELISLDNHLITARRNTGAGWQEVRGRLPVLLTVVGEANEPRAAAAKKLMKYKNAKTPSEIEAEIKAQNPQTDEKQIKAMAQERINLLKSKGLLMKQWDLDFLGADLKWCGRDGSPTKVHRIQSVILTAKESKQIEPTDEGVTAMIHELIFDKTIS